MDTTAPLALIGVDIGKEVFHLVGFGIDGKIAFRRKIKRLALIETFKKLLPCVVGMEPASAPISQPCSALTRPRAAHYFSDLCEALREGPEDRLQRRRGDRRSRPPPQPAHRA